MPTAANFALHPQLASDCHVLGDLPLCRLLRMDDAHYPWFILVPRLADVGDIHALDADTRDRFWAESHTLSQWIVAQYAPDKLNVAALGNKVAQLHLHHVARYRNDAAWPAPVWGHREPVPLTPSQRDAVFRRAAQLPGLQSAAETHPSGL